MTSLSFEVAGPVVPWCRTALYQGRRITPKRQREYQDRVRWAALRVLDDRREPWPKDAQYRLRIDCYRGRRRFDLDNALKTYGDALNGVLWDDDSQVWSLAAARHVDRKTPRTVVCVEVIGGDE